MPATGAGLRPLQKAGDAPRVRELAPVDVNRMVIRPSVYETVVDESEIVAVSTKPPAHGATYRAHGSVDRTDDAVVLPRLFNRYPDEFRRLFHRPHGGLGGQTPYERLRQKSTAST
jgi:hypothetical protein